MRKTHVALLAVLVAAAAAIGTYAVTRTTELGVQARAASSDDVNKVVATRTRRLDTLEAQLHKALTKKPPALPSLPKVSSVQAQPVNVAKPVTPIVSRPATVTVRRAAAPAPAAGAHEHDHEASGGEHDD
jgi:hypothetical protein